MKSGQVLGGYEIVGPIGAGGMGEVYRARDPRLGRDVAVKILPPLYTINSDRLQRFEQEARAAGMLNHPNLLTVYELGVHDGAPYIVTELLEGETLRSRLEGGSALAPRRVIDYAIQIASGLAAAHEKGVVHRDLKPENLFLTRDGRVKILDFGLAKLATPVSGELGDIETMKREQTAPGTVMGTVGYMAPEQVRGQAVDHRADLFSLGAVMYEMLSGRRAFHSDSSIETMNAILKDDPAELSSSGRIIPPALQRIVEHCLEKNAEARFQSARDLAFHLEAISSSESGGSRALAAMPGRRRALAIPLLVAALLLLVAAGAFVIARRTPVAVQPKLHQLSFLRGTVRSARFAPDGQTIIYGASIGRNPIRMFQTRVTDIQSAPMQLPDGDVLSIAPNGELAISVGRKFDVWVSSGTLATSSLVGGAPRPLLENVSYADFSPDGSKLAIVRHVNGEDILEFPIGRPILRTRGYFSHVRVSHDGTKVAFLDHPFYGDNRGNVAIADASGTKTTLVSDWAILEGMAWSADGKEVWFTGDLDGTLGSPELYGVDLRGHVRTVWVVPASMQLLDVARDGRVLVAAGGLSGTLRASSGGAERELSTPAWTTINAMTPDGKFLLASSYGAGSGRYYSTYLAPTDGSPAVRLGEGDAVSISDDGRWAISSRLSNPAQLLLLPTGAGQTRVIPVDHPVSGSWMSDGRAVIRTRMKDADHFSIFDPATDRITPLPVAPAPRGLEFSVSPDARWLMLRDAEKQMLLFPMAGGPPQPAKGVGPEDHSLFWENNETLRLYGKPKTAFHIERVNVMSGTREPVKDVPLPELAGVLGETYLYMSRDGSTYATSAAQMLNDLYFVEGLR